MQDGYPGNICDTLGWVPGNWNPGTFEWATLSAKDPFSMRLTGACISNAAGKVGTANLEFFKDDYCTGYKLAADDPYGLAQLSAGTLASQNKTRSRLQFAVRHKVRRLSN